MNRALEIAIKHHAMAEKSDPFAARRMVTQLRNGIAYGGDTGRELLFRDQPATEKRKYLFNGQEVEYDATVFKNRSRP